VKALIAFVVTLAALVAPGAAGAADCTKTSVSDVEDEVMCPVCGTSLGLAREAPQAKRESAFIARLVERCHSKDEIKAALVAEFGDGVLALPSSDGFNLSAYLAPLLGMLLAAGGIGLALVRWRRAAAEAPEPGAGTAPAGGPDARDAIRLDAELRRDER
jgi:cytochrome c-type biogenesis protein CcmH